MNVTQTRHRPIPKPVHHGRTPAAWTGSMLALVGFIVLCAGFVFGPSGIPSLNMPLIYVGAALLIIAPIVGGLMNRLGFGQD